MGHKVYLVIEKMSEIAIVLDEAERLNVVPRLGVRARLASQGSGMQFPAGGKIEVRPGCDSGTATG